MEITEILTPERIVLDVRVRDKAQLIGELGRIFERLMPALQPGAVEAALLGREQFGSTGLGAGFALPHARVEGLGEYLGLFVRLIKPIDFDAIDTKPVQFVFALLIPPETATSHVSALAAISRLFRDGGIVTNVGKAKTPIEAYGFLTNS